MYCNTSLACTTMIKNSISHRANALAALREKLTGKEQ